MSARILVIDAGTTSVKACLFSGRLELERKSLREYTPEALGNRVEMPGSVYLEAVSRAVREAAAGERVDALGITTQGETLSVADAAGNLLRPFLVWLDQRAEAEAEELRERFPDDLFYRETGLPALSGAVPLAKALWLRRHEPHLFIPGSRLLLLEDYLLFCLTDRFVTEKSLQTSTGWFSLRRDGWWPEALAAAGLEESLLPEALESGAPAGRLTARAAEALGLSPGIPVFTGAMDQVSASWAMQCLQGGSAMETTGTALVAGAVLPGLEALGRPGLPHTTVYRHAVPGKYMLLPIGNTGGMSLTWFRDRFCPGTDYGSLCRMAQSAPPGADGLLFLPFLDGSVDPDFCPEARGVFFGASLSTGREHFARAVLEGVGFLLADMLEIMESWGAPAAPVVSLGGGARSPVWEQIKADICGREFRTLPCEEAAALGAALLAGHGAGLIPAGALPALSPSARYVPNPQNREIYERARRKYRALYRAVRPLYENCATGGKDHE